MSAAVESLCDFCVGILLCIVSKMSYFAGWGLNYSIGHLLCIDICLDCCWLRRRMSNKARKPMHITMMRMANSLHFLSLSSGPDVPGSGGFWLRGKIPSRRFSLPSQIVQSLVLLLWKWEKSFRGLSLFYFPSCIISARVLARFCILLIFCMMIYISATMQ